MRMRVDRSARLAADRDPVRIPAEPRDIGLEPAQRCLLVQDSVIGERLASLA